MKDIIFKFLLILSFFTCFSSYSQNSSFIVTNSNDTVYVKKFSIKSKNIKVKLQNGKKKRFSYNDVKSLYNAKKKMDFQKIKPAFVEYSEHSGTVFFAEKLTKGKIRIYNAIINHNLHFAGNAYGNQYSSYYIGIYDSKPELINREWDLKLTKDVYKILKLYLHSNNGIQKKLDDLFFSTEEDEEIESKIIDLVNEYNESAASNN